MKRIVLALAIGAAFAAPGAYADVTISGNINMGPAWVKSTSGGANSGNSVVGPISKTDELTRFQITNNYSNITIASIDDLGGGLKLDFAAQLQLQNVENQTITNRNSHIGLVSDSWGGVWYGTNENIYERYLYTIDPLDGAAGIGGNLQMLGSPGYGVVFDNPNGPFGTYNSIPTNGSSYGAGFYRRDEHSVWYDSPNFSGFTFGGAVSLNRWKQDFTAATVLAGLGGGPTCPTSGCNPWGWQAGLKYASPQFPLQAWTAYAEHKDYNGLAVITALSPTVQGTPTSTKDKAWQAGIAWTFFNDLTIFGIWEQLKYKADGLTTLAAVSQYKVNHWSVGGKWNVPTGYIGAQYVHANGGSCETVGAGCSADQSGAWMVGLGYYHNLSKQTQGYVMATVVNNQDNQWYGLAGAATPLSLPGSDQRAVTVGLKHSF